MGKNSDKIQCFVMNNELQMQPEPRQLCKIYHKVKPYCFRHFPLLHRKFALLLNLIATTQPMQLRSEVDALK